MNRPQYRQGDVLLIPIDQAPDGNKVARENGRLILAHGEVTGHSHSIAEETAELVTTDDKLVTPDEAIDLYLLVHGADSVELTHQEHDTITVEPGAYRVVRQREYEPDAIRRVAD